MGEPYEGGGVLGKRKGIRKKDRIEEDDPTLNKLITFRHQITTLNTIFLFFFASFFFSF